MTVTVSQPLHRLDMMDAPVVAVEGLGKVYPSASGSLTALRDVSLQIHRRDVFGIIGRSGAGKSTLIRTINRLETPTSGRVVVHGIDIGPLSEDELVVLRRGIGMIFQHFNLLSAKTVWENVALPLRVADVPRQDVARRVAAVLDLVGLADKKNVYPVHLSGGQKQRVGIARALVHEPDILLCDEAASALDPEATVSILALLRDLNRRLGITIILITHEMAVIREICDRVAVLEKGQVVEGGPVWSVFGDPQHAATLALLRPLGQALPADFADRLRPTPQGPDGETILSLGFVGDDGIVPDLGVILALLGGQARVLYGNIDRIQGRAVGRLLVSLPAASPAVAGALKKIEGITVYPRVLGYVDKIA
jgi:D-methionine transport system ATP-binding protein